MDRALGGDVRSPEELCARGRNLREERPPAEHDLTGAARPGVLEFAEASNAGRRPDLVPLRNGRMVSSPFSFFRGAAGLMAADLAGRPSSGLFAHLCDDAHASNLGLHGTPDGQIVMDINDFDETISGPWEWDFKRPAARYLLGWATIEGRPFVVRQFRAMKGSIDPTTLRGNDLDDVVRLAALRDAELDATIGRYAARYADRTEADHAELVAAAKDRKLSSVDDE
ncbi:MAG TPA: DUF2252 family protein [Amycolatopsis sp.]|nr:DUF2252 family protein [Amycolatopsis sp.]